MPHIRLAGAALLLALACLVAPSAAAAQEPSARLGEAGRLSIDYSVDRFVVRDGKLNARGTAVARLSGVGEEARTARRTVVAPVRIAQAGGRQCALITLNLQTLRLDLLGLRVETSEINLRISGIRRGEGSGVLGRVLCSLNSQRVRISSASGARTAARTLNSALPRKGLRAFRSGAMLVPAVAAQQATSCQVLNLLLGPLELNVLGLLVELYGENRRSPVTITITAFRGGGVLGDLFCGLAGAPPPAV